MIQQIMYVILKFRVNISKNNENLISTTDRYLERYVDIFANDFMFGKKVNNNL